MVLGQLIYVVAVAALDGFSPGLLPEGAAGAVEATGVRVVGDDTGVFHRPIDPAGDFIAVLSLWIDVDRVGGRAFSGAPAFPVDMLNLVADTTHPLLDLLEADVVELSLLTDCA